MVKNEGSSEINRMASFAGEHSTISVDGKPVKASFGKGTGGKVISFVNVAVRAGQQVNVFLN